MGKSKFNLEKRKSELSSINSNIEKKKQQLEQLKEQKQSLIEERTAIEGKTDLDDSVMDRLRESINEDVENNRNKSLEVSAEMNEDMKSLENMKQESQDDISSANDAKSRLEKTKGLLERFGIGKALEGGINDINSHLTDMQGFQQEIMDKMKEMDNVSQELNGI